MSEVYCWSDTRAGRSRAWGCWWTRALLLGAVATFLFARAIYVVQRLHRRATAWIDARSQSGLKT
jgi:hypothetical protein